MDDLTEIEKENARLREEIMRKDWEINTMREMINRSGLDVCPPDRPSYAGHDPVCTCNYCAEAKLIYGSE
jgi:hypothetical protein